MVHESCVQLRLSQTSHLRSLLWLFAHVSQHSCPNCIVGSTFHRVLSKAYTPRASSHASRLVSRVASRLTPRVSSLATRLVSPLAVADGHRLLHRVHSLPGHLQEFALPSLPGARDAVAVVLLRRLQFGDCATDGVAVDASSDVDRQLINNVLSCYDVILHMHTNSVLRTSLFTTRRWTTGVAASATSSRSRP